ncbi:MAG: M48 family metallopeptidase [Candidatus Odinarchaeota archaeon]
MLNRNKTSLRLAIAWKWILLLLFFTFDFLQVLLISMTRLEPESSLWGTPFRITFEGALDTAVFIIILTFLIRTVFLLNSVRRLFSNTAMLLVYHHRRGLLVDTEKDVETQKLFTRLSPERLVNMTLEIAKISGVNVDRIYISKTPVPNAFTIDTFPIPFIRRSYIVINSNVIDVLSLEEIKAVIAHEIGHISASDSTIKLIFTGPGLYLHLAYLYIYIRIIISAARAFFEDFDIILSLQRLSFLAFTYLFVWIVSNISMFFLNRASRQSELLADVHGAEIVGKEPYINMLIKLGQRYSCIETLYNEITWLEKLENPDLEKIDRKLLLSIVESFPQTELDEKKARMMAPELFLRKKLENMERYYNFSIPDPGAEKWIKKAADELLDKRIKELEQETRGEIVDWRESDIDQNQNLEKEEIDNFVKILKTNPDKFLFKAELLKDKKNVFMNHPNFKDRILNIYEY